MDLKSGACNNPNNIITVNAETITEVLRLFEYLKNKRRKKKGCGKQFSKQVGRSYSNPKKEKKRKDSTDCLSCPISFLPAAIHYKHKIFCV